MLREFKEIIADYGILGLCFGILAIVIRPAQPWMDNVKEVVAAITLAIIIGLILRDTGLSDTTIFGIIGGCSCFARIIFEGIGRLLTRLLEKPLFYCAKILRVLRGGKYDGSR